MIIKNRNGIHAECSEILLNKACKTPIELNRFNKKPNLIPTRAF